MPRPLRIRPRGQGLIPSAPPWMARALCRKVGRPDDWHPDTEYVDDVTEVCQVCAACPVRQACLDRVLDMRRNPTGVWAGTTTRQRRFIRNARRKSAVTSAA